MELIRGVLSGDVPRRVGTQLKGRTSESFLPDYREEALLETLPGNSERLRYVDFRR